MAARILYLLRLRFAFSCDLEEHRGDSGLPRGPEERSHLPLGSVSDSGVLPLSGLVSLRNVGSLLPGVCSVGIVHKESPLAAAETRRRPRAGGETHSVG